MISNHDSLPVHRISEYEVPKLSNPNATVDPNPNPNLVGEYIFAGEDASGSAHEVPQTCDPNEEAHRLAERSH